MNFDRSPEQLPQLYSLSVKEFRSAPVKLVHYNAPEKVTRENFVDFLIQSFAISKGKLPVQIFFMIWVKAQSGFDSEEAMRNLAEAGGYDALSEQEQEVFMKYFSSIKKHTDKYLEFEWRDEIVSGLYEISNKFSVVMNEDLYQERLDKVLSIESFAEFKKFAEECVMWFRRMMKD